VGEWSAQFWFTGLPLVLAGTCLLAAAQALYFCLRGGDRRSLALPASMVSVAAWLLVTTYLRHQPIDAHVGAVLVLRSAVSIICFTALQLYFAWLAELPWRRVDTLVLAALGCLFVTNLFTPFGVLAGTLDIWALEEVRSGRLDQVAYSRDLLGHGAAAVIVLGVGLTVWRSVRRFRQREQRALLVAGLAVFGATAYDTMFYAVAFKRSLPLTMAAVLALALGLSAWMLRRAILAGAAERALAYNEQRAAVTLESLSEGLALVDGKGQVVSTNKAGTALLGDPGVVPRLLDDMVSVAEGAIGPTQLRERVLSGERVLVPRASVSGGAGEQTPVSLVAVPLSDVGGGPGMVLVLRDLREQLAYEERLRRARDLELGSRMARFVLHDLNNLVTIIRDAGLRLRQRSAGASAVGRDVDGILDAAASATLLSLRLTATQPRKSFVRQPTNVNRLMERIVQNLRLLAPASVTVRSVLALDGCAVDADPIALESALLNLGVNAAQALQAGGTVTLRTGRTAPPELTRSSWVVEPGSRAQDYIEICDDGAGIDASQQRRLFEPFYGTSVAGEASGLGLTMVEQMVSDHGGGLWLRSAAGQGSRFVLALPRSDLARAAEAPRPAQRSSTTPPLIIIDDSDALRRGTRLTLEQAGYGVLDVADGHAAVDLLRRHGAAAAIVDYFMPKLSGPETILQLRQVIPELPILVVSGYLSATDMRALVRQPRLRVITKPFDPEQLVDEIRQLVA
jgi:signal transduction histidine kinase/CheY-like chemotaxis protein